MVVESLVLKIKTDVLRTSTLPARILCNGRACAIQNRRNNIGFIKTDHKRRGLLLSFGFMFYVSGEKEEGCFE